ncbi:hypothetical protein EMWEY_00020750, partial [Eimeria maxima]
MQLGGLRFLVHVSPNAPLPPSSSLQCCCSENCNSSNGSSQQQQHKHPKLEVCEDEAQNTDTNLGKNKRRCTEADHLQQQKLQQHQEEEEQQQQQMSQSSNEPYEDLNCRRVRAHGPLAHRHKQTQQQQQQQQQISEECAACGCKCPSNRGAAFAAASASSAAFTPIYSSFCPRPLLSVNAGDPQLYVGGGSINLAFLNAIRASSAAPTGAPCGGPREGGAEDANGGGPLGGPPGSPHWRPHVDLSSNWGSAMGALHSDVLKAAKESSTGTAIIRCGGPPGGPQKGPLGGPMGPPSLWGTPFSCLFGMVPEEEERQQIGLKGTDAFVCIDIIRKEIRPLNINNIGMAYVVGPKGWTYTADKFYETLFVLSRNLLRLVLLFNEKQTQGGPSGGPSKGPCGGPLVQQLRMPLVSGGAFKGDKDANLIAAALIKGFLAAAAEWKQRNKPTEGGPQKQGGQQKHGGPPDATQKESGTARNRNSPSSVSLRAEAAAAAAGAAEGVRKEGPQDGSTETTAIEAKSSKSADKEPVSQRGGGPNQKNGVGAPTGTAGGSSSNNNSCNSSKDQEIDSTNGSSIGVCDTLCALGFTANRGLGFGTMLPKPKRRDKHREGPPPDSAAVSASSLPERDTVPLGAPRGPPSGAPLEEDGPRSSRRRSRRLRDRSPPDYSADEILALVAPEQQQQQQRQKKRGASRGQASLKPSSRRFRREEVRESGAPHSRSWGPLALSSSGKIEGGGTPIQVPPPPPSSGSAASSSSSLRALAVPGSSAAAAADEACVLVPLNQARALLACASPAAVQLAAAAAAAAAANSYTHEPTHDAYSTDSRGGPWGAPRLGSAAAGEGPPVHTAQQSLGMGPPYRSTHPYRHASMSLSSFPKSRLPALAPGGPLGSPRIGGPSPGVPSLGLSGGPPSNSGRWALSRSPLRMQPRVEEALLGAPQGGPPGDPPVLGLGRRRSSSDTPLLRHSPFRGQQTRRLSLRDTQAQHYPQGAPGGAPVGPPRVESLVVDPRTPERIHTNAARALNCSCCMHDQQQQQQLSTVHRIEARGAAVRRPLGAPAATAAPWGAPSSSLQRAPTPFSGAPVVSVDSLTSGFEAAATASAAATAAADGGLLPSRERGPQEGPFTTHYRETDRHLLRTPAHLSGPLRAPPDTPSAGTVLHLEGPPQAAGPPPADASIQRSVVRGAPPAVATAAPGVLRSSPLGGPPEGPHGGPFGGPSLFSRGPLPAFDALAALLAPPLNKETDLLKGDTAAAEDGGGPPPLKGPLTVSRVYMEAAFPSGAPHSTAPGGPHGKQNPQQLLAAVSAAAAQTTLRGLQQEKGTCVLRLPWRGLGGAPDEGDRGAPNATEAGAQSPEAATAAAAAAAAAAAVAAAAAEDNSLPRPPVSSSLENLKR